MNLFQCMIISLFMILQLQSKYNSLHETVFYIKGRFRCTLRSCLERYSYTYTVYTYIYIYMNIFIHEWKYFTLCGKFNKKICFKSASCSSIWMYHLMICWYRPSTAYNLPVNSWIRGVAALIFFPLKTLHSFSSLVPRQF